MVAELIGERPRYADLPGSAINQDGRSATLTSPLGPAQVPPHRKGGKEKGGREKRKGRDREREKKKRKREREREREKQKKRERENKQTERERN